MAVLQVSDVAFGWASEPLFEGVAFGLEAGERVALVAPNGAGKTTLLRIVAGEIAPDRGTVWLPREARVAFSRQSHEHARSGDVLGALLAGFEDVLGLRRALREAEEAAADGTREALDRLGRAADAYHAAGGDALERRVETIASRLGFGARDLARPVASLSGGELGRLYLGAALARDPDVLLLDEPTNHLDLDTIDWLEDHLASMRAAAVVVSHDRAFLDNVTTGTLELGRRTFRAYPLRWSDYAVAREADLERERALAERQADLVAKTEEYIRRNIAGQKAKQAQSRRKMLDRLERVDRPEDAWAVADRVRFRFAEAPRTGDVALEATQLGADRGGRRLFEGVDLLVRRGDRVGVVGPNGSGKTTLLRLLACEGEPGDRGVVRRGSNVVMGYFDQHLGSIDPDRTGIEEVRAIRADMNADAARTYLARFRFWGDMPMRRVAGLSGGERTRLALAKLLLQPRNLLLLDEPTNHLDIPAAQILEEALVDFPGTVVLVSHDRRFLENVTTRTVWLRDGRCDVLPGGWRDVADQVAPGRPSRGRASTSARPPPPPPPAAEDDRAARKAAWERDRARAREIERKRRRLADLEEAIAKAEAELGTLRARLRDHRGDDWEALAEGAAREQSLTREVEAKMAEWSALGDALAREEAPGRTERA